MDENYINWGKKSLYIFLILSFFGVVFYTLGKFAGDPDFYESIVIGLFNISFLISVFLLKTENIFSFSFLISWVFSGLIWFFAGVFLAWILKNKETNGEKLKHLGKILMITSIIPIIIFLILSIFFAIKDVESAMWFFGIFGVMFIFPLFGFIFGLGLIFWFTSKFGFKRVMKWLIILVIIFFIIFLGFRLVEWGGCRLNNPNELCGNFF